MINSKPPHPCSEAFVEPELIPPVHSDKVAKPLVSKLVGHNVCYPVSVAVCRCGRIEKQGGSTTSSQWQFQ